MLPNVKKLQKTRFGYLVSSDINIVVLVAHKYIYLRELPKHMKNLDMQKLKWLYVKAESFCISE